MRADLEICWKSRSTMISTGRPTSGHRGMEMRRYKSTGQVWYLFSNVPGGLSPMLVLPQKPQILVIGLFFKLLYILHGPSRLILTSTIRRIFPTDGILQNGLLTQSKKTLFPTVRRVAETLHECLGEPSRDECHLKRLKPGCMISDLALVSQYMTQVKEDCNCSDCGDDPFITGRVRSVQFPTLHHNANSSDTCHLALRMHRAYSIIFP